MLYITTRVGGDAFTANRALSENRGPEGGLFLPMRMPYFDEAKIMALPDKSFAQNMADILNLLFHTQLDSWAVEFGVGRYPVKLISVSPRVTIAETWHNPAWRFSRLATGVEKAIRQSDQIEKVPGDWLMIAARIAVLFGIFGQLLKNGAVRTDAPIDVAVPSGNFSAPMAVWYARAWGLPIANIVVCCNENSGVWNLLHRGELRTDAAAVKTDTPASDFTVPTDLERLIFSTLGAKQTAEFVSVCRRGGTYYLSDADRKTLQAGLQTCVVSSRRMESAIPNLYKTDGYIADPYTALCYSGLIDYRSRAGENRPALLIADESPAYSAELVARCMGISPAALKARLDRT